MLSSKGHFFKMQKATYLFLLCFVSINLFSQIDLGDEKLAGDSTSKTQLTDKPESSLWKISGFFSSSMFFALPAIGVLEDYELVEPQGRVNLKLKYGMASFFVKASADLYLFPDLDDIPYSHANGKIEAREFYFSAGSDLRIKIGKQLFLWGVSDFFRVTDVFDQPDRRTQLSLNQDDQFNGVYSIALEKNIAGLRMEAVFKPQRTAVMMPPDSTFWLSNYDDIAGYNVSETVAITPDFDLAQSSVGVRYGGVVGSVDLHFFYYNGYNNNLLLETEVVASSTTNLVKKPLSWRVNSVGFDLAFSLGSVSFRVESLFTFDMPAISSYNDSDVITAVGLLSGSNPVVSVSSVQCKKHIAATAEFDFAVRSGKGRVFIGGSWETYLSNDDNQVGTRFGDLLYVMYRDKFYDNRLLFSAGGGVVFEDKLLAAIGLDLGYDFSNGLTLHAGGYFLLGMAYLKAEMKY